jgi:hypothetical protein
MDLKEVNEIRSQIGQLRAKIQDAEDRLESAALKALGLSVNDRIFVRNRYGIDALIEVRGCTSSWGTPRPEGVKVKKDGTAGVSSAGYIDNWRHA